MTELAEKPAHWVLAEMGKSVLRPGGRELTLKLLDALDLGSTDDVIEFAPGVGFTAKRVLERDPRSYTAVELDREAADDLERRFGGPDRDIVVGNAANTRLDNGTADVVLGEAMLTMHPYDGKESVVEEGYRLLRSGGRYGVHELGLKPDSLAEETKTDIQTELTEATKVNARPQTVSEWVELLESAGFDTVWQETAPMHLLEPRRLINDEGLFGALRFAKNALTHPEARQRVRKLRSTFSRHEEHMEATAVVAEKP